MRLAPAALAAAMDEDYLEELVRCSSDPLGDNTLRGLQGGLDVLPELRRWHSMSQLALLEKAVFEVEDRCVARAGGAAIFDLGRAAVPPCTRPAASCSARCSEHPRASFFFPLRSCVTGCAPGTADSKHGCKVCAVVLIAGGAAAGCLPHARG